MSLGLHVLVACCSKVCLHSCSSVALAVRWAQRLISLGYAGHIEVADTNPLRGPASGAACTLPRTAS